MKIGMMTRWNVPCGVAAHAEPVGRAWVANEKRRTAIIKKKSQEELWTLPDLRLPALFSAVQVVILFPFVFQHVHGAADFFIVKGDTNALSWIVFTFDGLCKSLLDWSEVYRIHFTEIDYRAGWGSHLIMIKRLTVDLLLVQGIIRLVTIANTTRDVIDALPVDPDLAVRVGDRATGPLIREYDRHTTDSKGEHIRFNAVFAMGNICDPAAISTLERALQDRSSQVQEKAVAALRKFVNETNLEKKSRDRAWDILVNHGLEDG